MAKVLDQLKKIIQKRTPKNVALFVDGPNMLRKELKVDLSRVKKRVEKVGKIKIARVFLNQYASDKLIEAVTNQGFEVVIIPSDVDVALAVDATQSVFNEKIEVICIASRDSDFKPVLTRAKEFGKDTVVVGAEPDFSIALQNTADTVINLSK